MARTITIYWLINRTKNYYFLRTFLDDDFEVRVHEVHDDGDVGLVSEHVNQLYHVVVMKLL